MNFTDYFQWIMSDNTLLPDYFMRHIAFKKRKLKQKGEIETSKEYVYLIKKGVIMWSERIDKKLVTNLAKKNDIFICSSDSDGCIQALEEVRIISFKKDDLLSFLEEEQLANVFWSQLLISSQKGLRRMLKSPQQRLEETLLLFRDAYIEHKLSSGVVPLPLFIKEVHLAQVSGNSPYHFRIQMQVVKDAGYLWKEEKRFVINLQES